MGVLPPALASTDGVTIALHELGGSGPLLLWSHATGFHARCYLPLARRLADRFHSVGLDYRAHGDSTAPDNGRFDWDGMAEDLAVVVDQLDRPLVAVGHSMGGAALLLGEIARPGTFAGLVVYEPIVFPPDRATAPGGNPLAGSARRRRSEFPSHQAAYDNFAAKPPLNVFTPEALHAYVEHGFHPTAAGTVQLACAGEHEAATYEGSASHGAWARLGEVGCPVLVLSGAPAEYQPSTWAHEVAARLPQGTYRQFERLGHFGPMEDPDLVAHVVDEYLGPLVRR
jgi:pimeloyl-ACP methyl ester carboxylesterase